jgi:hypothetical protein
MQHGIAVSDVAACDRARELLRQALGLPLHERLVMAGALFDSARDDRLAASPIDSSPQVSELGYQHEVIDEVTIITATSPIPMHPSTRLIREGAASLCARAGAGGCRHLIVCDGSADTGASQYEYTEYKRRLRALCQAGELGTRAAIVEQEHRVGLPGVILCAFEHVRTPLVLVFDHDWEWLRRVDLKGLARMMLSDSGVQCIRFNKRRTFETGWDTVLKADCKRRPRPLTRTSCWSGTPHLATVRFYRERVLPRIAEIPGGGAVGYEEPVNEAYWHAVTAIGFDKAQSQWGVFIYGRLGDPAVVRHLDGRHSLVEPVSVIDPL